MLTVFRKEIYKQEYGHMMQGMNSIKFWGRMEVDPPQPPPERRMPGRPAKNRKKEEGELCSGHKMSRKGRKITCQLCYQTGHNKQTCKAKNQSQQDQNMVPEAAPIPNQETEVITTPIGVANDQCSQSCHPRPATPYSAPHDVRPSHLDVSRLHKLPVSNIAS